MEKVIRIVKKTNDTTVDDWLHTSPEERLNTVQDLREMYIAMNRHRLEQFQNYDATGKRLQRVYRIVKRSSG